MAEALSSQNYLLKLKKASKRLRRLSFPVVKRPDVPEDAPPTRELVDWAIRLYSFSLLSHYREMLRSFLHLLDGGMVAAATVIGRCLFEMGAQTYYVHKHVKQHVESGQLAAAWDFLFEVIMGSKYMREEIPESETREMDFPAPLHIAKVMRCFNEYGKNQQAAATYSSLSEYVHPNMAAFSQYWREDPNREFKFAAPPCDPGEARLPVVRISLISSLQFTFYLLVMSGETEMAPQIKNILLECAEDPL